MQRAPGDRGSIGTGPDTAYSLCEVKLEGGYGFGLVWFDFVRVRVSFELARGGEILALFFFLSFFQGFSQVGSNLAGRVWSDRVS